MGSKRAENNVQKNENENPHWTTEQRQDSAVITCMVGLLTNTWRGVAKCHVMHDTCASGVKRASKTLVSVYQKMINGQQLTNNAATGENGKLRNKSANEEDQLLLSPLLAVIVIQVIKCRFGSCWKDFVLYFLPFDWWSRVLCLFHFLCSQKKKRWPVVFATRRMHQSSWVIHWS